MNSELIVVSKDDLERLVSDSVQRLLALNLDNGIGHVCDNDHLPLTVTVEDMAAIMHISLPTAYELTKQKGFPSFRMGRRILISRKGLQTWIDEQCQGG